MKRKPVEKPSRRRKGNVDNIDFTGVKAGGSAPPEGRYKAKIIAAESKEGQESGEPYRELTWEITSDKCNGREVRFDNYSLQPQALFRLRGLLEALEVEVEEGGMDIDWDEIISDEKECIIDLLHDERNGNKYAKVAGIYPLADGGTVDDEEDSPKAKRGSSRGKSTSDESEDDDPPKRRRTSKDDDDDDDPAPRRRSRKDEDEEEEEDDKPRNRKLKKNAEVTFKDEKGKKRTGVIDSIDGDKVVVIPDDDEETSYELETEEVTVVG